MSKFPLRGNFCRDSRHLNERRPEKIRNSSVPESVIKIVYHALYIIRVIKIHAAVHTTVQKYQGELKSLSLPPVSVYFQEGIKVSLPVNIYLEKIGWDFLRNGGGY
mgnify:CR=1 FL=1